MRTTVRGPYASDDCFLKWVGSHPAEIAIGKVIDVPALGDPVNDRRLYIVYQAAPLPTPLGCSVELVTSGGHDAWETQAQAQAVINGEVAKSAQLAANIKAANEKATSIGNVASGAAKQLLDDAGKASKGFSPLLVGAGVLLGGYALYKLLK